MKRTLLFILLNFVLGIANAQDESIVMEFEQFMAKVKQHHPMARQSQILIESGDANLMMARGSFDPKLQGNVAQKYFKDDQYYSIINGGLKIPTWYGISFQTGVDMNQGSQLNPERYVPDDGLWYAGVTVALGRGMIIDQRRAELKKAKIFVESSVQAQRLMMNDLLLQSSMAYWDWFKAYNKMVIYQNAVENALERFNGVKQSAFAGDKPFIDTVEANIQLQNRLFNFLEAELEYDNATSLLEIYLWDENYMPLEMDDNMSPPTYEFVNQVDADPSLYLKIDSIKLAHPELLTYQYKIDQKRVDLQLSRENLKPQLNLKYNAITEPLSNDLGNVYSINNYTWGADFSFPIFLRKERGKLKISKLQIENLQSEQSIKSEQLSYKIEMSLNIWSTSFKQIGIWRKTTQDYNRLLSSEQVLFDIGESSLFMINSREKSYIEAQLKLVEKITDNRKAELKTNFAMGMLDTKY